MDFVWRVAPFEELRQFVTTRPGAPSIMAIDGRSSSGKTTLARRLAAAVPGAAMVHTDDIVERERTWERADLVVNGSGTVPHDPATEVVIA